jgi:hypothetical protein
LANSRAKTRPSPREPPVIITVRPRRGIALPARMIARAVSSAVVPVKVHSKPLFTLLRIDLLLRGSI